MRARGCDKMEKAILAESIALLERLSLEGISRVYFGQETCERKIPLPQECSDAKRFCEKNSLGFSLLTPFATDAGAKKLKRLFSLLSPEDEIIANDFGVMEEAKACKATVVAGRLLNRQFRDPRIASFHAMPQELLGHLSLSQAGSLEFRAILSSFGVKRVELDNLLQGTGTNLAGTGFSASLYYPFAFVSATRMCLLAGSGRIQESKKVGIFECGRECQKFRFRLTNEFFPKGLLLSGNALFFENEILPNPKELSSKGIDRLVINRAQQQ